MCRRQLCLVYISGITMLLISVSFVVVTLFSAGAASVIPENPNVTLDPLSSGNEYINNLTLPSSRIINGFYVSQEMPWIVLLLNKKNGPFCTGSLINEQYILTAAHCVSKRFQDDCRAPLQKRNLHFQAIIGENNNNNARYNSNNVHQVVSFWTHPQYDHWCNKLNFDFAVLKLQMPVSNSPVCLHSGSYRSNPKIYAIGYGQTNRGKGQRMSNRLKAVEVINVKLPQCTSIWGYTITENKVCTGGAQRFSGTCNGDSGGPLVLYEKSGFIQIGVTSYGSLDNWQACNKGKPDVYGRVSSALSFIRSKAGTIKTC